MNYHYGGKEKSLLKEDKKQFKYGLKKIGTRLVSCIIGCAIILGSINSVQAESRTEIEHSDTVRNVASASNVSEWKPDTFEDGSDAVVISESGYSKISAVGWQSAIADPNYTENTDNKFGWSAKPGGNSNYADELIRVKGTLNADKTSIHWKVVIKGTNSGDYKGVMRDFYRPYYLISTSRGLGKPENWKVSNSTHPLTSYPADFDKMKSGSRTTYIGSPTEVRFPDGVTREFNIFGVNGYPVKEWAGGYRLGVTGPNREDSSNYNIEKYMYYSSYMLQDWMYSASIQDSTRVYEFDTKILPNEVHFLGKDTPNVSSEFGKWMGWGQGFRKDVDFTDKVWITVGATSREATGPAATKPNGTGIYNFSKIATIDISRTDADKHDPQGRTQTVNMGDTPAPANSLESVPAGSQVSYKTPVDTSTPGDQSTTVVVTYPDGSTDEIPVTITIVDSRSDADKHAPQGRAQTVTMGDTPDAANSLDNLPAGSQVSYKTPVDTSTPGDQATTVVVTYPDGSTDEIPVTIIIVDSRSDADKHDPQGRVQTVTMGDTPAPANSLESVPAGSQVAYKTPVDTSTPGDQSTTVVVTYPDGSTDEIPVTITIVDPRSDADKHAPQGRAQIVTMGDTPAPANSLDSVPAGSQVSYKTPVDTSTPGDQSTTVVVTYPDGSTDEIPVTITIVDPRSDADKHDPRVTKQTVNMGDTPDPSHFLDTVPAGSQVSYKTPVDTSTPGDQATTVVVTYPDGSTDEIPVTITIVDPRSDADKHAPQGRVQTVTMGAAPDPASSLDNLPAGSQVAYKTPVDTSTPGDQSTTVVVTYPDGSTDEIPVTITIVDPRSDADKHDPQGRAQTVNMGDTPAPANSLESVPAGSQVAYKTPVDTSTPGDQATVVVVTYPDGSIDEIPVTITIVDSRSDADKHDPRVTKQTVNMGDIPAPANSLDSVPAGSQVSYKTPVDTSTPGDHTTTVVVTYPDGSIDEIPVTITIVDPRSDADKHDPRVTKQTVNMGDTPDPANSLDTVPAGSQVSYKTPVDTSTPGDQAITVVVTYPDGSTDEIPVTITIVDSRSDADKHGPQGSAQTVTMGAAPDPASSLANLPAGSQVSYKTPVDTSIPGDKVTTVVVTYPDGSTDEIPVTITIVDSRSDADKHDPQGRVQAVTMGAVPVPANSLANLPVGSQVSYKTPVDTGIPGDQATTVVVTYPDGSTDEIPVTITIVDPRSDREKHASRGTAQVRKLPQTGDLMSPLGVLGMLLVGISAFLTLVHKVRDNTQKRSKC
ncbi:MULTISPECIES: Rib/alpha-like domain-containing protein [unclassified Streptococcus]|uniref:Rib/alpha-like domain-containing protein n=1 Tax=unclassified Streptococcus TaxID=2608887 RepID=UPI001072DCCC|nr:MULTISPECIES: Rib/alpha-like domain-containing protein [unclassified Streptococcus]TFV06639.1 LPXTG cell wall anchor domain-containing protein [Streptococcus sp. LYSM12]